MGRFTGVLGMAVILGLAWLFSTNRRSIKLKTIAWGLGLQLALGFFVLRSNVGSSVFGFLGAGANKLLSFSYAGSTFVFGDLGLPKELSRLGFSFAFQVLPTIIFIAAFFAVLYHLGVMQLIIRAAAWLMTRIMSASGAESLNVAASIFMGQTEAPLTIRPFLPKLTKSELMVVMTSGMAHISGGMMGGVHNWPHMAWFPESLQTVFGWVFAPVAWLIGVPWHDAAKIGNLLGTRMVINEFVAFGQLGPLKGSLDPRTFAIATFALCGFANFSSIGIQIGGIGALAPEQRSQLARFGIRAMLAGTMANLMSASIVGILS